MAAINLAERRDEHLPVLTAVGEPALEAQVVAALARPSTGLTVARRCVDLADLLAVAATRTAVAALVSPGLRRLDREAVSRLEATGLAVVGVVTDHDEAGEARLRQLGLAHLVVVPSVPGTGREVAAALADAIRQAHAVPAGRPVEESQPGDPERRDVPLAATGSELPEAPSALPDREPLLVAVWGPTGAPGRSTVCWHLAGEFAARGHVSLVVDADVYGGALAQLAGLVDEAPGLVAACRAANLGALDIPRLLQACRRVPSPGAGDLRMLTGLPRAARWPELKPSALEAVLGLARRTADVLLVDCGFCLEDEEVSYDSLAPRRNAATLAALAAADVVLVVGAADPLGLTRLVHGLDDLRQALPAWGGTADVRVVVNRLRASRSARREVRVAVERHAGATPFAFLPFDPDALEQAQDQCRPLAHSAPRSPLRLALEALAADLVPDRATQRAPRRRRLRAG